MPPEYVVTGFAAASVSSKRASSSSARARPRRATEMVEVGHQAKVLLAGHQLVDGGELSRHTDRPSYRVGLTSDVVTGDEDLAGIGVDERREDTNHRCLAGAVRSEQREDRPGTDGQVDLVEHCRLAE